MSVPRQYYSNYSIRHNLHQPTPFNYNHVLHTMQHPNANINFLLNICFVQNLIIYWFGVYCDLFILGKKTASNAAAWKYDIPRLVMIVMWPNMISVMHSICILQRKMSIISRTQNYSFCRRHVSKYTLSKSILQIIETWRVLIFGRVDHDQTNIYLIESLSFDESAMKSKLTFLHSCIFMYIFIKFFSGCPLLLQTKASE